MQLLLRLFLAAGIALSVYVPSAHAQLTPVQTESLVLLARVWGFAKYHHPAVASGAVGWDGAMQRAVPKVLAAPSLGAARDTIDAWLAAVGDPQQCVQCVAAPGADAHLSAPVDWIRNEVLLGRPLSERLQRIHKNRPDAARQFQRFAPGVQNPVFASENTHTTETLPPADLRLLGVFRFWNILEYWFPYRDLMEVDRVAILREFIPEAWNARTELRWNQVMMRLVARAQDGHANLWSSLSRFQPPIGTHQLPVTVRVVEGKFVVSGNADTVHAPASGLRRGDILLGLDGASVDSLARAWAPYRGASNETARLHSIARTMTRGAAGPVQVDIQRNGRRMRMASRRVPIRDLDPVLGRWHDRPGEAFQRLSDSVAYLKLSSIDATQIPTYVERASGARVLVIDIRNYPSQFVVFALGRHLVDRTQAFARFTSADPGNPGAFLWRVGMASIVPAEPRFAGRVVLLVDESSMSQAEYTAMAFRTAPGALVVGSTTAGADGNVSEIPLPGGLRAMISGIGVFYPDKSPTQQVGIVPDIRVTPTLAGIRAGRDEVLEAAIAAALRPMNGWGTSSPRWQPPE